MEKKQVGPGQAKPEPLTITCSSGIETFNAHKKTESRRRRAQCEGQRTAMTQPAAGSRERERERKKEREGGREGERERSAPP